MGRYKKEASCDLCRVKIPVGGKRIAIKTEDGLGMIDEACIEAAESAGIIYKAPSAATDARPMQYWECQNKPDGKPCGKVGECRGKPMIECPKCKGAGNWSELTAEDYAEARAGRPQAEQGTD